MSDYYLYRSLDELLNENSLSFLNKISIKTNQWVVQYWKINFPVDRNKKLLVKIKRNLWNAKKIQNMANVIGASASSGFVMTGTKWLLPILISKFFWNKRSWIVFRIMIKII